LFSVALLLWGTSTVFLIILALRGMTTYEWAWEKGTFVTGKPLGGKFRWLLWIANCVPRPE
jgi:hypothetical protein